MDVVRFKYRNHRGEEAIRTVRPIRIFYGCTAWHPEAQWLCECWDLEREATRDFAMSNMLSGWERVTG
jgi:predicted DNA-binding transcriptional regulator YafY